MILNRIICLFVAVFLLFGFSSGVNAALSKETPDFSLMDTDGKAITMSSFKGKSPILIVFFATWCPPCRREVPELIKIYDKYSKRGLRILAVNIQETPDRVKGFMDKEGINYLVLIDSTGQIAKQYGITGIPTAILIDKKGDVKYRGHSLPDKIEEVL
ncbi:MAG: TlpA disulfide reductase family protein [Candidatus Omnitrophica bacterium]|nr:TlpA disulfide reductase family protein [Candidatus Omnitrophota bacterium]